MILATVQDPWTGTNGRQVQVLRIHTPEQQQEMAIRVATAAVAWCIEEFGEEEASRLTLNEILQLFVSF